jgi:NAD(P)H dehydrogenase (quinone)
MIIVTGASGHLGRLVIEALAKRVPPDQIVAAVRSPDKVKDLAERGVIVRQADYDAPDTLATAFAGGGKLLLISASVIGRRATQHRAVIAAARKAGVELVVYTSILHADTSGLSLAGEHLETERAIRESGIPFVFLRNGWYMENYSENLAPALANGTFIGSARDGRIAAAPRADFAEAAVRVLASPGHQNAIYELAGDEAFTMKELAAEVSRQTGKRIDYQDLPPEKYQEILTSVGVPEPF